MTKIKSLIQKRLSGAKSDAGLSIPELLIAVGLSGLLALGCTQLAMASFASANYTQTVAVKSLNTGNINRLITKDMENATGFLDSSGNPATRNALECSSANSIDAGANRALVTLFHADGSSTGYEVRSTGNIGALWRVTCPTAGIPNGASQILQSYLPAVGDSSWNNSIVCARFPAGGSLTSFACDKDVSLKSMTTNPGIIFTVPATISIATIQAPEQKIIAARNVG